MLKIPKIIGLQIIAIIFFVNNLTAFENPLLIDKFKSNGKIVSQWIYYTNIVENSLLTNNENLTENMDSRNKNIKTIIEHNKNKDEYRISYDAGRTWKKYFPVFNSSADIHVFPNPTTNKLFINLEDKEDSIIEINIFDLNGNQMIINEQFETNSLILNELKSGTYILKIFTQNGKNSTTLFIKLN